MNSRASYFSLGVLLFALINLPKEWTERYREKMALALSPLWLATTVETGIPSEKEIELLQLRKELDALQAWASDEKRLEKQREILASMPMPIKDDLRKKALRQKQLLSMCYAGSRAQVVFRDPTSWNSTLWIALGESENKALGRTVIARNSPVLAGHSVVGVVEYVGEKESRVRLITDSGLVLAVRALRGGGQNRELLYAVNNLLDRIKVRPDLFSSAEEEREFTRQIQSFGEKLKPSWEEEWLAKGEISGCSAPLWRSRGTLLKGIGFNYHFADEEGPARDLKTGKPLDGSHLPAQPLLKAGDLLITSGLDGLFPAGLPVAIATEIAPLKEESCFYELEAKPTAGDLQDLHTVFILPPIGVAD